MFKIGDKVICIDNSDTDLILNKIYNIIDIQDSILRQSIKIININDDFNLYYSYRFKCAIKFNRKQKLNKICSEKEKH